MSKQREQVKLWLEWMAERQRRDTINQLEEELDRVLAMTPVEYVRQYGLHDVCPAATPEPVRQWLGLSDSTQHYSVRADSGNEGSRLEVGQGNREWDYITDPWGSPE